MAHGCSVVIVRHNVFQTMKTEMKNVSAEMMSRLMAARCWDAPDELYLKDAIAALPDRVDIEKLRAVLADVTIKRTFAKVREIQIDWRREWPDDRRAEAKAIQTLRKSLLRHFLTAEERTALDNILDKLEPLNRKLRVQGFPVLVPKRRKKRGNQAAPYTAEAIKGLRRLGLTKEAAIDWLRAVGVKKPG